MLSLEGHTMYMYRMPSESCETDYGSYMIEDKNSTDISTALDTQYTIKLSLKYPHFY